MDDYFPTTGIPPGCNLFERCPQVAENFRFGLSGRTLLQLAQRTVG